MLKTLMTEVTVTAEGTSNKTKKSDSESSSSSSESHVKIPAQVVPLAKETKGGTSMRETKTGNPNSSQMPSLPKANHNTEEE